MAGVSEPAASVATAVAMRLAASGGSLELWWRDDDFDSSGRGFEALKRLAGRLGLVPLMAAIPARLRADALRRLEIPRDWRFCQHGWRHLNHEPAGQPRSEFGDSRAAEAVRRDLQDGRARLQAIFGDRTLDVLVPPWNRFAAAHEAAVVELGYRGFSDSCTEPRPGLAPPIIHAPVQVDVLQLPAEGPRCAGA